MDEATRKERDENIGDNDEEDKARATSYRRIGGTLMREGNYGGYEEDNTVLGNDEDQDRIYGIADPLSLTLSVTPQHE